MLLLNEHVQFPYRASNPSLHIIADGRATITPLRGLYSVFPLLFIKKCVFIANSILQNECFCKTPRIAHHP